MQLTPQRTNPYSVIDTMLENNGVHEKRQNYNIGGS